MTAVVAGLAFILATVTNIAGTMIVSPILDAPDYLAKISLNEGQMLVGAFLIFVGGIACAGIALAMYPVLRRYDHGLALGSVAFRTMEAVVYVLIAVCFLVLVTLSEDAVRDGGTGSPTYLIPAAMVKAVRTWLGPAGVLTFGLGGLMYYWVFFRSRVVPRWLSGWGLLAILSVMVSGVLVIFNVIESRSTAQIVLAAPIALQEMVLAVWLIVRGFSIPAAAGEPAAPMTTLKAAA